MNEEDKKKVLRLFAEITKVNSKAVLVLANQPELSEWEFRVYTCNKVSGGILNWGNEHSSSEAKAVVGELLKRPIKRKKLKNN